MASPEWFFSTLAQSSAAIIGFVLAFSAVLHQLERQQREKRTDTLRDELIELKQEYQSALRDAKRLFAEVVGESELTEFYDKYDKPIQSPEYPEELFDDVRENLDIEYPRSAVIAVYLNKIHGILADVDVDAEPSNDYLLDSDQFDQLRDTLENLIQFIYGESHVTSELYGELTVGSDQEVENPYLTEVFGSFEEDRLGVREPSPIEKGIAESIGRWLNEKFSEVDVEYSGKNIRDIMAILNHFSNEFQKVDAHRNNTLVDYEPTVSRNSIKGSAFLALTGVFTPIALLLTLPQSAQFDALSGWSLTLVQAVVLVLSAISTAYLLFIILKNLDGTWTGLNLLI